MATLLERLRTLPVWLSQDEILAQRAEAADAIAASEARIAELSAELDRLTVPRDGDRPMEEAHRRHAEETESRLEELQAALAVADQSLLLLVGKAASLAHLASDVHAAVMTAHAAARGRAASSSQGED